MTISVANRRNRDGEFVIFPRVRPPLILDHHCQKMCVSKRETGFLMVCRHSAGSEQGGGRQGVREGAGAAVAAEQRHVTTGRGEPRGKQALLRTRGFLR